MAGWGSQFYTNFKGKPGSVYTAPANPYAGQNINIGANNPGPISQGGSGLAPGYSVVNGVMYFNGQPITPEQSKNIANGGFIPTPTPTSAVPGTYDPSIDFGVQNANQGYLWTAQDYARDWGPGGRNEIAYNTALSRIGQQEGWTLADLLTGQTRATEDYNTQSGYLNADYATGTKRLGEDYNTATGRLGEDRTISSEGLARQYGNLGIQQAGAIRAAGAGEGGALAQALQKRNDNQAWDQGFIDRGYNRGMEDVTRGYTRGNEDLTTAHDRGLASLTTAYNRGTEDYGTNYARAQAGYANQRQELGTNYQYGRENALTEYQRAGISNSMFNTQSNQLGIYQAQQAGMLPETGQYVAQSGPHAGQTYRVETQGGVVYHRYANGELVPVGKA